MMATSRRIEATLGFLKQTEIATRKWALRRENWGEEEDEEHQE